MHDFLPFLPYLGLLLAALCLAGAFRSGRRRRWIDNLPTCKTTGVFIGMVELKGTAESARPLTSYLAEQPCVHYQWSVDEHWSRTVTETYTDSDGKTKTRTRHESGWTTVAHGGEMIPFLLRDDCGTILVRPEGAQIEAASLFGETCGLGDPLYYGKGPQGAVSDSDHRRRFVEQGIPLGTPLYVVGQARERQDVVAPEIAADPEVPLFLISTRSEEQVSSAMKWGARVWTIVALVLAVGGFVLRDAIAELPLESRILFYVGVAAGFLAFGVLVWVWMVFNGLVDLRQRVRQAWSLVEIQLKRRHDLIPNLVRAVQGYADYEQTLQQELAALRTQLAATPPGQPGADYGAVAATVQIIAERYPDLKANEGFLALHKNLVDTEQRIALARGYFNDIATHFNNRLEVVPEGFVGQLAGMRPQTLMAANQFERARID